MISFNQINKISSTAGVRASNSFSKKQWDGYLNVKHLLKKRHCNLCSHLFMPLHKYQLFCGKCRSENESYLFHEWLPQLPETELTASGH